MVSLWYALDSHSTLFTTCGTLPASIAQPEGMLQAIEKPVTSKLLVEHSEKRIYAASKHVGMVRPLVTTILLSC